MTTITSTAHMNRKNIPALLPDEIRFEAGGQGWMGTYGQTVRRAINDILEDGEPVEVTFAFESYDTPTADDLVIYTGLVTEIAPGVIHFADGQLLQEETDTLGQLVMVTL